MNNLLTWVSATLWILVLGCSLRPLWWRRDWRFYAMPCLLAITAVAQMFKLQALQDNPDSSANLPVFITDVLAVLAVTGYTFCLNRLARDQSRYEQVASSEQQARIAADAEKAHAAAVLDRVNDSFFSLDEDWKFTFVSKEASRLMRDEPEAFLGRTVWEMFPDTAGSPFEKAYRGAMATQKPVFLEARYEAWDRWFENRIYPSTDGLSVFFHDITERKLEESRLQSAQIQLNVAVAASNIGLWDWDVEHSKVSFSPVWKAQLGYKPDEIQDEFYEWENRVHPDDYPVIRAKLDAFLADSGSEYEVEMRMRHKDGSYRWILTRADLERGADGKPLRMRGCHIDITERKRAEEELRESQRDLRALGAHLESVREEESARIARELHDELGQSLTAIKLDLKWLAERLHPDQPESGPLAARVTQAINLTNDTIKRVRRICLELRPALLDQLGLPTAIEWLARDFETHTGVAVDVSVAQELANLPSGVATSLFRISQEALTNVAKHADASHVEVTLSREHDCAELCIRDNGRGISAGKTARSRGFGVLGMRERAMAVGGKLKVVSKPGEGVSICVSIPLAESAKVLPFPGEAATVATNLSPEARAVYSI